MFKRVVIFLTTILIVLCTYIGYNTYKKYNVETNKVEYKIDITEFKIKNILATNKLESLQIEFQVELQDKSYDKSKFKWLDDISRAFTTRDITILNDYKAIYGVDLSKAEFSENNGNYLIKLNIEDIECNIIQQGEPKVKETESIIGCYFDSQSVAKILNEMNNIAKSKIDIIKYREIAKENAKNDLLNLFKNVDVDISKVTIE